MSDLRRMTRDHRQVAASRESWRPRGRILCRGVVFILAAALAVQVGFLLPAAATAPQEQLLEDLHFRVNALVYQGAARAGIILKSLGGGRYRADLSVEYLGLLGIVSGQRRDNFQTEMIFREDRLAPLVYREETRWRGKYRLKEYRFDYDQGRLELWTHHKGKGMRRQWEMALTKKPIYDPLSAFYNFRMGALGPQKEGEMLRLPGIPYPRPEEIVIRIGPQAQEGRKVMISFANKAFEDQKGVVFVFFDEKWAPIQAWTRVLKIGKVVGEILPESKPLTGPLPGRPSAPEVKGPGN